MIRPLQATDIPRVIAFVEGAWVDSKLGHYPLSREALRNALLHAVAANGDRTFAVVSDRGGAICGLFVGELNPVYLVSSAMEATDVLWLGGGRDAPQAVQAFHAWAWARGAVRVSQSVRDTMGRISPGAVRLLERQGFEATGMIFEREREL